MGAAIWSTTPEDMFRFPAKFFFSFFQNHGLLTVNNRPQWYVINNGSKSYVEKLIENFKDKIRTNCSVKNIKRFDDHIELTTEDYGVERFDYVFIA